MQSLQEKYSQLFGAVPDPYQGGPTVDNASMLNRERMPSVGSGEILPNPNIDPINIAAGLGGSIYGSGLKAAAGMMPGMMASEVPVGMALDQVEELTGRNPYVSTAANIGLSMMGGKMIEGPVNRFAGAMADTGPKLWADQTGAITWHGSPHKWDKPDISKIGTGEGAQAYGHGFYSAKSPDVAKSYAPRDYEYEDELLRQYKSAERAQDYDSMEVFESAMMYNSPEEIAESLGSRAAEAQSVVRELYSENKANLYKLDLPDEQIERMLDWDKSLNEQGRAVKEALSEFSSVDSEKIMQRVVSGDGSDGFSLIKGDDGRYAVVADNDMFKTAERGLSKDEALKWLSDKVDDYTGKNPDGSKIYRMLQERYGKDSIGDRKASEHLNALGIPGIKYLDQGSRDIGEGSYNYVSFDPSGIDVLERNGEKLGMMGGDTN